MSTSKIAIEHEDTCRMTMLTRSRSAEVKSSRKKRTTKQNKQRRKLQFPSSPISVSQAGYDHHWRMFASSLDPAPETPPLHWIHTNVPNYSHFDSPEKIKSSYSTIADCGYGLDLIDDTNHTSKVASSPQSITVGSHSEFNSKFTLNPKSMEKSKVAVECWTYSHLIHANSAPVQLSV